MGLCKTSWSSNKVEEFKILRDSIRVEESEILKLLNILSIEALQIKLHHIGKFVEENRVFKVDLFILPRTSIKEFHPSNQKAFTQIPQR